MRHPMLLVAALVTAVHADPLGDALQRSAYPIAVTAGKLEGKGADVLRPAITSASFVALGEDHGIAQIPGFAAALCAELAPHGFHRIALEVGPSVAPQLEHFARDPDGLAQAAAFTRRYPETVAFYDWTEELAFLRACAAATPTAPLEVWGIDQELMGATGWLAEHMRASHPGPVATKAIDRLAKDAAAARAIAAKTGDYAKLYMLAAPQAALDAAKAALATDGTPEARADLDALLASRAIYQGQSGPTPYLSNRARARLMKATFLDDIGAAAKTDKSDERRTRSTAEGGAKVDDKAFPKVLVKLGAYHLYRGLNPLHSTELGNLINEAAEGHRVESANILIVGKQGTQLHPAGVGKPPAAAAFALAKDPDMAFLAPFFAAAAPTGWTLFDLRALRPGFRKLGTVDAEVERAIFGYDFLVIIPDATPSHPL